MQMNNPAGTGALVQIVHILGDDHHVAMPLEFSQRAVCCIGFNLAQALSPRVVKVEHQLRVARPGFRRRHVVYRMVVPQAAVVAKGRQAAFGADTSTTENHHFAHAGLPLLFARQRCQFFYGLQVETIFTVFA